MAAIEKQTRVNATELDDLTNSYLTFQIDNVLYSLELSQVIEILGVQPITRIPDLPIYIKGITNLRGKILPIIDVRLKFNQPERPYDDKTCIVVVLINDMNVGLIVDSVAEVVTIDKELCTPPPDLGTNSSDKYLNFIAKVDGRVIMNIDNEKFFQSDLSLY